MKGMKPVILCWIVVFCLAVSVSAADMATPAEIIKKVQEASAVVQKKGKAGFEEFNDPNGKWVWGGTYVFIMQCSDAKVTLATHPIKPGLIGKDLAGLKDKTGNYFFLQLCEAAKSPKGGWTEYLWPKPGEKKASRKISYTVQIPGTSYQAGAGIYDDTVSLEKLQGMLK